MIVIAVLGLLVPGYLLARAMRSPVAWAAAFPLSVVLLTETVIAYAILGIPISFGYVFASILVVSLVCLAAWLRSRPEASATAADSSPSGGSKVLLAVVGVQVSLVLLGILVRTALYPLSGFDTPFRWDALARLMLTYQGLSYYPPVTSEDFTKYTYPDGFPPLVSTVYWWLYAAWGGPCPAVTSVAVFLQAASCFAIVFYGARTLFGPMAGLVALAVLSSSSLFLSGIASGQETGYTALSCAGQLAFAFAAARAPKTSSVVMAGLFGGLGALAREYGPLLSLSGFAVLACQRETRRFVPLFCLVSAVCGSPWYIRNWVQSGNPVYPNDPGLGLPGNPVHLALMATDHQLFALRHVDVADWVRIGTVFAERRTRSVDLRALWDDCWRPESRGRLAFRWWLRWLFGYGPYRIRRAASTMLYVS